MMKCITDRLWKPVRNALLAAGVVAAVIVVLNSSFAPGLVGRLRGAMDALTKQIITVNTSAPVVVERLQLLNRLETARQVSTQAVEARSDVGLLPAFLGRDRLAMLVYTEMVAGVDMSRLTPEDIQVTGSSVTIHMPGPQLFSVSVDDARTQIFVRQRGLLVFTPDPKLDQQARLAAITQARESAASSGVIELARRNAEQSIRGLVLALGFKQADFLWADQAKTLDVGMRQQSADSIGT